METIPQWRARHASAPRHQCVLRDVCKSSICDEVAFSLFVKILYERTQRTCNGSRNCESRYIYGVLSNVRTEYLIDVGP